MIRALSVTVISLFLSQAFAVEYQSNLAPRKGEMYCKVRYTTVNPRSSIDLDLRTTGFDVADLESYDIATGKYSKAGRIVILRSSERSVDVIVTGPSGATVRANGLSVDNETKVFDFGGSKHVLAKVIFEIENFIKVSCASNL